MYRFFSEIKLKTRLVLAILALLSIPAILPFFHQGFFPMQDSVFIARIYENFRGLSDGQFPVRWAADLRYGEPLFNFYAPLPYYAGSLIHLFQFSYIDTSKILFVLGFILSGFAMFFLARELFGTPGGVLSSVLYLYAPYHSVDIYVRGALSEEWALIFFPLIFLSLLKLARGSAKKDFLFAVLSFTGLFITHNIMTVLFMPFLKVCGKQITRRNPKR